jgi:putative flippase GtrA
MNLTSVIRSSAELVRYYQAGIVNSLFGYGLYAFFVAIGFNMYVAQVVAHVIGVAFNYLTYSRHAFRGSRANKARFILSYVANYFLGLVTLAGASIFIRSPYVAGFVALVVVSVVNYFVLKHLVFTAPAKA